MKHAQPNFDSIKRDRLSRALLKKLSACDALIAEYALLPATPSNAEDGCSVASSLTYQPTPNDLLDEREAARVYSLAVATLRNWRVLKQGPRYVKLGKRAVRYRRADLEAFIQSSQVEGGAV